MISTISTFFSSALSQVPAVVWSGLGASLITIGGVYFSDRRNTARIKMQLRHDADEKTKERYYQTRQEVYLKFSEELIKIRSYLSFQMINIVTTKTTIEEFEANLLSFQLASARVQLIADPQTILLTTKLTASYSDLFRDLRDPLSDLIVIKKKFINLEENAIKSYQRLIEKIEADKEDVNQQKVEQILEAKKTEELQKHKALQKEFRDITPSLIRSFALGMEKLTSQETDLMTALRYELSITGSLSDITLQKNMEIEAQHRLLIKKIGTLPE